MTLACKYVDEVIIGAPFILTSDLINTLNIQKVIEIPTTDDTVLNEFKHIEPLKIAKDKGILVSLEAEEGALTIAKIAERVY